MAIDVDGLRASTPGVQGLRHFNNAGSGLMSRATLAAVAAQLDREARAGQMEAASAFDDAKLYESAAKLLNASPTEIAVVESHSRGFGAALGRASLQPGDRVLVTRAEWAGNVIALGELAQRTGATLEVMPVDEDGVTDVDRVRAMLDARVRIICVTWCPANGGLINPAAELVALGRQVRALTVVDASQAVGQMPIDVHALGCDVLTAPGRKFLRAPRGTALLYVAKRVLDRLAPAVPDNWSGSLLEDGFTWRDDARRFENPDMPPALKAGLLSAIEEALALNPAAIQVRVSELARRIRVGLSQIERVTCRDLGRELSCLVSLTIDGVEAATVKRTLAREGVAVGINGRAYTPFDMQARGLGEVIRISPHVYTSDQDIEALLTALRSVARF